MLDQLGRSWRYLGSKRVVKAVTGCRLDLGEITQTLAVWIDIWGAFGVITLKLARLSPQITRQDDDSVAVASTTLRFQH